MKRVFFLVLIFMGVQFVTAQTTKADSAPGWQLDQTLMPSHIHITGVDREALILEDEVNEALKIGPYRFGKNYDFDLNVLSEAQKHILSNGDRIYTVGISAPGAVSLNLIFDHFYLPQGAELFFYASDHSDIVGSYTNVNNNEAQVLATELIFSESGIIELFVPAHVSVKDIKLRLSSVTYGYKNINDAAASFLRGFNDSGDCNYDVNCPLGIGWEDQVKSVALIIANGNGLCSGVLLNNTQNNGIPYLLTADHCGDNPSNWVFRFRWESSVPSCATTDPSGAGPTNFESLNGAVVRAKKLLSDFQLVQLNTAPDPLWEVYYAGWDKSDQAVSEAIGIHHPDGDIKKICWVDNPLTQELWMDTETWKVSSWTQGVTEPGSSGSPLFDPNKRVIGQLSGGDAACSGTSNNGQPDYYGRFAISWDGSLPSERLKDWLDPNDTDVDFIDGYDPLVITENNDALAALLTGIPFDICGESTIEPVFKFRNNGINVLTEVDIVYALNGDVQVYEWTGSLASGDFETISLPVMNLSNGEDQTFKIYTSNPNGVPDEDPVNDTLSIVFNVVTEGYRVILDFYVDCNASEVDMTLEGLTDSEIFWFLDEGDLPDTPFLGEGYDFSVCMADDCGKLTITDSGGDGWNAQSEDDCFASVFGVFLHVLDEDQNIIGEMEDVDFGSDLEITFCFTADLEEENNLLSTLEVFPNPADGIFYVQLPASGNLNIFDMSGRLLLFFETGLEHKVDMSAFENGMYLFQWSDGYQQQLKRVIKY